jgi:hypothetical protein
MKKRIVLVLNGKGGVGKSFFAVNFVQFLKDRQIAHVALDSDNENSTRMTRNPPVELDRSGQSLVLGVRAFGRVDRQPDFEASVTGTGFKFNLATMTVADDAVADDQAKAGAGADGLCGEKWLEHPRLDVRGNARSVVHDFNYQLVVLQTGADTDSAGTLYSVDCVINEIGPHLIEFTAVSHDARDGAIECPNERNVPQFVTQHRQGALNPFVDVHLLHRGLIHVRIRLHGFDQFCNSRRALLHLANQRFQVQSRFQPGENIGMASWRKLLRQFGQPG